MRRCSMWRPRRESQRTRHRNGGGGWSPTRAADGSPLLPCRARCRRHPHQRQEWGCSGVYDFGAGRDMVEETQSLSPRWRFAWGAELWTADYSFVNAIPGPASTGSPGDRAALQKTYAQLRRAGSSGHGSVLGSYGVPDQTSPIRCGAHPPPPPVSGAAGAAAQRRRRAR